MERHIIKVELELDEWEAFDLPATLYLEGQDARDMVILLKAVMYIQETATFPHHLPLNSLGPKFQKSVDMLYELFEDAL